MSGSAQFILLAKGGGGESDTLCPSMGAPAGLFLLFDVENSHLNAGMPDKSLTSALLPSVNFFRPASAFRHQGQSGTAGH
jgi:hypothetical protein